MSRYITVLFMLFCFCLPAAARETFDVAGGGPCFTANAGQWDGEALFHSSMGGCDVWLTETGPVFRFMRDAVTDPNPVGGLDGLLQEPSEQVEVLVYRAILVGTSEDIEITGVGELDRCTNFYLGNDQSRWRENVPRYGEVVYSDVYPGIDLRYYGVDGNLKYDFIVRPGGDPGDIRIRYEGVDRVERGPSGELSIIVDGWDPLVEGVPSAFILESENPETVDARYLMIDDLTFGFDVDPHDTGRTLVIDPMFGPIYSTYLGGSDLDNANAVAIDVEGRPVIIGTTASTDLPTEFPYQGVISGDLDAFVSKFDEAGGQLLFSTYLGGKGIEYGNGIDLDEYGGPCLTGTTSSQDFPLRNAFQQNMNGVTDVFVARLSWTGHLMFGTYLGGGLRDDGMDIAVNEERSLFLVGKTCSRNFPIAGSLPLDPRWSGGSDAFFSEISESNILVYSTYWGGRNDDWGTAVDCDPEYGILLGGTTYSSDMFTLNAYQPHLEGGSDAFMTLWSGPSLDDHGIVYITYLGGSEDDYALDVSLGSGGGSYVVGTTWSSDFPTKDAFQDKLSGACDGFVTMLDEEGQSAVFSTYLGGSDIDAARSIDLSETDYIAVAGCSFSSDFPMRDPYQGSLHGGGDGILSMFYPCATDLYFSTYWGGEGDDYFNDVSLNGGLSPIMTGSTCSPDFPIQVPFQPYLHGPTDACLVRLTQSDGFGQVSYRTETCTLVALEPECNPFRGVLRMQLDSGSAGHSRLAVYDIRGSLVEDMGEVELQRGMNNFSWDAGDRPEGVYIVRLTMENGAAFSRKVLLIR